MTKPRILVIDDDESSREFAVIALRNYFEVHEAESPRDGFKMLTDSAEEGRLYQGVLLDFNMPGMNGGEVLHVLRGHAQNTLVERVVRDYFQGDFQGLAGVHAYYHHDVVQPRPIVMYSGGKDLTSDYLSLGATGVLCKDQLGRTGYRPLLDVFKEHIPPRPSEPSLIPQPTVPQHA